MRSIVGLLLAGLVLLLAVPVQSTADTIAQTTQASENQRAWLGVSLAPVPAALSHQLQSILENGQGVLVEAVSPDSPAAKAGLQRWDLLLKLNDQKLYSPQQLASLIETFKPGDRIGLELVRDGKLQKVTATLGGAREPNDLGAMWQRGYPEPPRFRPPHFRERWFNLPDFDHGEATHVMEAFEEISVRKLGDDHYIVKLRFLDNNGEQQSFSVEGSYEEVRRQILTNTSLPEQKKNALLNALKLNPDTLLPDELPGFPLMPPLPRFDEFFRRPDSWF